MKSGKESASMARQDSHSSHASQETEFGHSNTFASSIARVRFPIPEGPENATALSAIRTALPQRMRRLLTELDRPRSMPDLMVRLSQEQEPDQSVRDAVLLLYVGALRLSD